MSLVAMRFKDLDVVFAYELQRVVDDEGIKRPCLPQHFESDVKFHNCVTKLPRRLRTTPETDDDGRADIRPARIQKLQDNLSCSPNGVCIDKNHDSGIHDLILA